MVYYKGVSGAYTNYVFPNFTTSHDYCHVSSYELDDNNLPAALLTPTGLSWETSCDATHLCSNIRVTIDTSKNFTFWIVVNANGGVQATYGVFVIVKCGLENMSTTTPSYSKVWAPNTAVGSFPFVVNLISDGIAAMFVSDLA